MKKHFLTLAAVTLTAGALILTGCSKDDVSAPVITLNGGDETVSLQSTYVDKGATAKDDKDGEITPTVTGNVDTKHTGVYTLTYSATDAAGNTAEETRTVKVVNDAEGIAGVYTCTITGFSPYEQTLTASTTENGKIYFSKFGKYAGNTYIFVNVTGKAVGSDILLPSQTTPVAVGEPGKTAIRTFVGKGGANFKAGVTGAAGFALNYDEITNGTTLNTVELFEKK